MTRSPTPRRKPAPRPSFVRRLLKPLDEPLQILGNVILVGGTVLGILAMVGKPFAEDFIKTTVKDELDQVVASVDALTETQKQTSAAVTAQLAEIAVAQKQTSADLALTQTHLKIVEGALEEQQRAAARVIELFEKSPALKER